MEPFEARENIKRLSTAIGEIFDLARKEGRKLSPKEDGIIAELEGEIEVQKKYLPASGPLSLQDFGSRSRTVSSGPFRNLGEQLLAIQQAALPGGQTDPRLYSIRAASGLNESVPSEGGFLVQQDFGQDLIGSVFQTALLAKLCKRIQISSNSNSITLNAIDETSRASGSRFGAIQSYWLAEAAEKLASKPKFRQMNLSLKKLIGLCYASDELLADVSALNMVIRDSFVSEFGFALDDAIINGTGSTMPLGILNSGCLVSVAKETGQKAATVVAENVIKMWSRLLPGSEQTAYWLINKNVLPQLFTMSLAVGTGGVPLYMPANSIGGQPFNTLFGRPVMAIEQAATLGTVGDIILADFQNGYILAEKGGIQQDVSIHVQFKYDESVFRFVMRVDGQPILAAPITPYKGSDTQSHFIALATRA